MHTSKQASGGHRWSAEQDARLLELANNQSNWRDIAAALNRSYFGVQNRFRFLKRFSNAPAKPPKRSTRSSPPEKEPDLSCGAQSLIGRQIVQQLWSQVQRTRIYQTCEGPAKLRDELRSVIGALAREAFLNFEMREPMTITISRVSSKRDGISREHFRTILFSLEEARLLERFVGYPGKLRLEAQAARKSRAVMIRASSNLVRIFGVHGIDDANLFSHFPRLG